MSKVYIETYGCTMNRGDAEIMAASLGDRYTDDIDKADIVVINSCGVKLQTERKNLRRIEELCDSKKVIVAGCLPKISPEKIDNRVRGLLDPQSAHRIREAVERVEKREKVKIFSENTDKSCFKKKRGGITAILPISEGCLGSCAYCGTKHARGNLLSFNFDNLIGEARKAVKNGYKQLYITSQDTGCYGFDTGHTLPELLKEMTEIEGRFRIRVGMMNPNHTLKIIDELIEVYRSKKIYNFLHIPVQSGDNTVLERMNRRYTVEEFEYIVKKFRKKIDDFYLCTDIIVGFPGETNEAFNNTVELIERTRPDKINVTRYSIRPNTEAEKMKQLYGGVKKERSRKLHYLRMRIGKEINESYVGKECEILVTRKGSPHMIGRMENYKPVVLEGKIGEFEKVRITKAKATYLMAV
ncbi:MAG: tRNA (N(6)-L-threonylcarbamoyladenosine(37)-C(2))-methylthiotransferase [Euryarchaeota archaeon]|nr:tRNA (N(6)-L-threonylcarbamoyladenosine(37)-C(2))-methylthiotransferase [Euryarchaeota archaeon]